MFSVKNHSLREFFFKTIFVVRSSQSRKEFYLLYALRRKDLSLIKCNTAKFVENLLIFLHLKTVFKIKELCVFAISNYLTAFFDTSVPIESAFLSDVISFGNKTAPVLFPNTFT